MTSFSFRNNKFEVPKVAVAIIEKDYILGWMLAGINAHDALNEN